MTVTNGYITAADLLTYLGGNFSTGNTNATMIDQAIDAASRAIDDEARRVFYPHVETNMYDVPPGRKLDLADDLLELLTLTNGDAAVIPSTNYIIAPYNSYPKNSIVLLSSSVYGFAPSTTNGDEAAISAYGIYGFHRRYLTAWQTGSTLASGLTDSATSATATSGTAFANGQIVRIDNELIRVTNVSTNTLTIERGWNGSTAAAHDAADLIKIWRPEAIVSQATKIQSARYYRRFETVYGTTGGGEMGVQPVQIPQLDPDVKQMLSGLYGSIL